MLVFPIGTPTGTGLLLWRHRDRINPPSAKSQVDALKTRTITADPSIAPLSQLFSQYKSRFFLFDVVDMCRRIMLTGALVFIRGRRTRAVLGLALSQLFVLVYHVCSPYISTPLNALSVSSAWLLVLVYGGGVMVISRPCGVSDTGLGVFLTVAVVVLVAFAVALQLEKMRRYRTLLNALIFVRGQEERNNSMVILRDPYGRMIRAERGDEDSQGARGAYRIRAERGDEDSQGARGAYRRLPEIELTASSRQIPESSSILVRRTSTSSLLGRQASLIFDDASHTDTDAFDCGVFEEMWNEGRQQQQTLLELTFGWLDCALEVPISESTWRCVLFRLGLLPLKDTQYGSLSLGIQLSDGHDGQQYAAILEGTDVLFADDTQTNYVELDEGLGTIRLEGQDVEMMYRATPWTAFQFLVSQKDCRLVRRMHTLRDECVAASDAACEAMMMTSYGEVISSPGDRALDLVNDFPPEWAPPLKSQLDSQVFPHLMCMNAQVSMATFKSQLESAFPQHDTRFELAIAPVKKPARIAVKIQEYRSIRKGDLSAWPFIREVRREARWSGAPVSQSSVPTVARLATCYAPRSRARMATRSPRRYSTWSQRSMCALAMADSRICSVPRGTCHRASSSTALCAHQDVVRSWPRSRSISRVSRKSPNGSTATTWSAAHPSCRSSSRRPTRKRSKSQSRRELTYRSRRFAVHACLPWFGLPLPVQT